jgi:peroxiredoxin
MKNNITIIALITLMSSCGQASIENIEMKTTSTTEDNTKNETMNNHTLKSSLDQRKADFNEKASDDKKRIYAEGIDAVVKSGVTLSAKQVGDQAPDFELTDALGKKVKLSERLKKGPVILTWYRGGWCPYCNITLSRLQAELPNFKAAGAELIALTPELPDSSMNTTEKNALDFQVLSDVGSKVARDYGVLYTLTDDVADIYNAGFGLDRYNGDNKHELPLAATYVIDRDGVIRYAFLDADYRNRAEPSEILAALRSLKD